jgi:hypothetical protein
MSAGIRAGSRFKRFLCFVLTDVRYFRLPHVEDHWSRECGSLDVSEPPSPVTGTASPFMFVCSELLYHEGHGSVCSSTQLNRLN